MPLPPAFLDELRARTPLPALIGRRVRLAKSGREWVGRCPFHDEKSPSFRVYDDHFHCFGCGAHGDAIGFVMRSEGMAFPEAVARLAGEAGLEVPRSAPDAAAEHRRAGLHDILAAAAVLYARRLRAPEGRAALDYLHRRGLTDDTIARFDLGWSANGRPPIRAALDLDVPQQMIVESGLAREDGRDFFFDRVMFPIRDRAGRVIGFCGRALGDAQPKYINGPETPLFSKRRTLYGLDFARAAVRKGAVPVIVEGTLDVIALDQAGVGGAVAPLGTALTEDHLAELWRLHPLPILCFDGDAAGGRAAARALELALPLLAPARSLRIAALPNGEDPDSLVRVHGAAAMRAALDAARPFADAYFDAARRDAPDTVEGRAGLLHRLDAAAALVPDKSLSGELRAAFRDRFYAARRRAAPRAPSGRPSAPRLRIDPAPERARVLTAILLRHPSLLAGLADAYERIPLPPPLDAIRAALLALPEPLDSSALTNHLASIGLSESVSRALADTPMPLPRCAAKGAMEAEAEAGWWHFHGLLEPAGLAREITEARGRLERSWEPAAQARLIALKTVEAKLADDPGEA